MEEGTEGQFNQLWLRMTVIFITGDYDFHWTAGTHSEQGRKTSPCCCGGWLEGLSSFGEQCYSINGLICHSDHRCQSQILQTNGYDCGLWVLAGVAAALRGCHCTALLENDMPLFRQLLYSLILVQSSIEKM